MVLSESIDIANEGYQEIKTMLRYCSKVCKYISGNLKHIKRSLMEET